MKKIYYLLIAFLCTIISLSSCKKEYSDFPDAKQSTPTGKKCDCMVEGSGRTGDLVTFGEGDKAIQLLKVGERYVMQGDMVLSPAQVEYLSKKASAGSSNKEDKSTTIYEFSKLWTNNTVYYAIDPNLPNQWRVTNAIAYWQANSPLTFVQRTTQPNYIYFTPGETCESYIGMTGNAQPIWLANGCSEGNAKHEIGHAIGLYHEQMRNDRGNFIKVNTSNVPADALKNFKTYGEANLVGYHFGDYDYESIMNYGSFDFSTNGQPVLERLDGSTWFAQRDMFSQGDIASINFLYKPIYVKHHAVETYSDSYYGTVNEYERVEHDNFFEFYADQNFTIPTTPHGTIVINYMYSDGYLGQQTSVGQATITASSGQTSVFVGHSMRDQSWEYGTVTRYEEHSFSLLPGFGYRKIGQF